jgi:hypothetical protein
MTIEPCREYQTFCPVCNIINSLSLLLPHLRDLHFWGDAKIEQWLFKIPHYQLWKASSER